MPGVVANMYKSGCDAIVKYYGKPHNVVYQHCKELLENAGIPFNSSRVCGVGDSLEHDILGASNFGCDSVWVMNGVHSADLRTVEGSSSLPEQQAVVDLLKKRNISATYNIPCFQL